MADIPGNTSSTYTFEGNPLEFASFSGELENFYDVDFIRVTLVAGQTYTFHGGVAGIGAKGGDSVMRLLDAAGNEIKYSDDDGPGANSFFSYVPTSTATYFISIRDLFGDPGSYSVQVMGGTTFFDDQATDGDDYSQLLAGASREIGGKGNDEFRDYAQALGQQGDDTLVAVAGGSTLSGGTGNDAITGVAGADLLFGDSGNDVISGGENGDRLYGGLGYDKLYGENGYDTLHGGDGADYLSGGGDFDLLLGDAGNDSLVGGSGDDTVDGGTGADTLAGGLGNDKIYVDNAGDKVIEYNETGLDTVYSTVNFDLRGTYAENLALLGTANLKGTGNDLGNVIAGNDGKNTIKGMGERDYLAGNGGNDTIDGGTGFDTLAGGAGADRLIGGSDTGDFFRFDTKLSSSNIDRIVDYKHGTDFIQLSHTIFAALGSSVTAAEVVTRSGSHTATTASQRLIYDKTHGTLWFDADGNKSAKAAIEFAQLGDSNHPASLDWHDFLIV